MKLENWSVCALSFDPYKAPEAQAKGLHGTVYGHPRFEDGSEVTTSRIVARQGDSLVTSSGLVYELGGVDPAYEAAFPDARGRLMRQF